jgi:hypothetical protein
VRLRPTTDTSSFSPDNDEPNFRPTKSSTAPDGSSSRNDGGDAKNETAAIEIVARHVWRGGAAVVLDEIETV